jgi:hypothetical protein
MGRFDVLALGLKSALPSTHNGENCAQAKVPPQAEGFGSSAASRDRPAHQSARLLTQFIQLTYQRGLVSGLLDV